MAEGLLGQAMRFALLRWSKSKARKKPVAPGKVEAVGKQQ